jgi:hypothetical protein
MVFQKVFDELAVGIDNGAANAARDIGRDHVPHERAFAGAGSAKNSHVFAPGFGGNHEFALLVERAGVVLDADRDGVEGHGVNDKPQSGSYRCGLSASFGLLPILSKRINDNGVQKMAAGDDRRCLVALREMPRVAGHQVVRLGSIGTFKKTVVGFVSGDGERLSWGYVVRNLPDTRKRLLNVLGRKF